MNHTANAAAIADAIADAVTPSPGGVSFPAVFYDTPDKGRVPVVEDERMTDACCVYVIQAPLAVNPNRPTWSTFNAHSLVDWATGKPMVQVYPAVLNHASRVQWHGRRLSDPYNECFAFTSHIAADAALKLLREAAIWDDDKKRHPVDLRLVCVRMAKTITVLDQ